MCHHWVRGEDIPLNTKAVKSKCCFLSLWTEWVAGTPALVTSAASAGRKLKGTERLLPLTQAWWLRVPLWVECVCVIGAPGSASGESGSPEVLQQGGHFTGQEVCTSNESIHWKDSSHKCRTEKWSMCAHLCPTLCDPTDCPRNSPGKKTGMGCHFLL